MLLRFYVDDGISLLIILPVLFATLGFKIMDSIYYNGAVTCWYLAWHLNLCVNNVMLISTKQPLPLLAFVLQYVCCILATQPTGGKLSANGHQQTATESD